MFKKPITQFSDYIIEMFPEETTAVQKVGARSVTIQVTDSCNLRCTYCYQINKHHNFIKIEDAKKFIDLLLSDDNEYINTSNSAGVAIDFIGGEPLLAVDTISEIMSYTIAKMYQMNHPWLHRLRFSICTNGTLYFDEKVQELLRRYNKFISFTVSIDGNKELHDKCRVFPDGSGSYDIAMAAVNHYRKTFRQDISTKMTLSPYNIHKTYEAIVSLIENGYTEINVNCVFEKGWTKELAKVYYYQLKQLIDYYLEHRLFNDVYISRFDQTHGLPMSESDDRNFCGGLGQMIAVNHTGKIYPCLRYMESSLGDSVPPVIIGDITSGIMQNDKYSAIVNEMQSQTRRSQSTEECFYCPIASGCAWCSAYCYQYYGHFGKRTTFNCDTHKAEVLANMYYWNKLYIQEGIKDYRVMHIPKEWALEIIPEEEFEMLNSLAQEAFLKSTS